MKKILLICLILISGSSFAQVDVTFKVDMRGYNIPFTAAYVNGTFNGWCGLCNPMTDANNDSIWELTIPLPAGSIEYKFTVDGWVGQENLTPGSPCTITSSGFTNRSLIFSAATVLPVNCWGKCGACGPLGPQKLQIKLPISWQDSLTTNLSTTDFGGTYSTLAPNPTNPAWLSLKITKTNAAELWAGTTLGTSAGFPTNIPFSTNSNQMQVLVYAPNAGTVFKLKAENKADPTQSVETDVTNTTANAWEVLNFNFANHSPGTSAINYSFPYNKLSLFPNFGVTGATAGEKIYYIADVAFGTLTNTKELNNGNSVSISPNPNSGVFEVSNIQNEKATIEVSDLLGRVVLSKSSTVSNNKVDISGVENGIYLVKIIAGGKTSVNRIVVNK